MPEPDQPGARVGSAGVDRFGCSASGFAVGCTAQRGEYLGAGHLLAGTHPALGGGAIERGERLARATCGQQRAGKQDQAGRLRTFGNVGLRESERTAGAAGRDFVLSLVVNDRLWEQPRAGLPACRSLCRPRPALCALAFEPQQVGECILHLGAVGSPGDDFVGADRVAAAPCQRKLLCGVGIGQPVSWKHPLCSANPASGAIPIAGHISDVGALQHDFGQDHGLLAGERQDSLQSLHRCRPVAAIGLEHRSAQPDTGGMIDVQRARKILRRFPQLATLQRDITAQRGRIGGVGRIGHGRTPDPVERGLGLIEAVDENRKHGSR